jgi:DNA-damage-inducible protein J
MSNNTVVRARINSNVKTEAMEVLEAMGLTISDAIRLLLLRVAEEKQLPFIVKVPNAATAKAMKELEAGGGARYSSVEEMFEDFGV